MDRATFTTALLAAVTAGGVPLWACARELEGRVTTQQSLFDALPQIAAGSWTRIILGSGAAYQKQIGAGVETDERGNRLHFLEMQVGSPGGSCNPSSMRKAYLRGGFGSLFGTYPLISNIGRTENLIYRFGDRSDGSHATAADQTLRLMDFGDLYDSRPIRIVSVTPQTIHAASRNVAATHVVAEFAPATTAHHRMRRIEVWHHASFPFGVVRYHAMLAGQEPFNAHVYAFGKKFQSLLPLSLARVRAMTPNGQYGQLPQGIGA